MTACNEPTQTALRAPVPADTEVTTVFETDIIPWSVDSVCSCLGVAVDDYSGRAGKPARLAVLDRIDAMCDMLDDIAACLYCVDSGIHYGRGMLNLARDQFEDAISACTRCLEDGIQSSTVPALRVRACAHYKQGNISNALRDLKAAECPELCSEVLDAPCPKPPVPLDEVALPTMQRMFVELQPFARQLVPLYAETMHVAPDALSECMAPMFLIDAFARFVNQIDVLLAIRKSTAEAGNTFVDDLVQRLQRRMALTALELYTTCDVVDDVVMEEESDERSDRGMASEARRLLTRIRDAMAPIGETIHLIMCECAWAAEESGGDEG